jgi:hypothetical protein
MADFKIKSAAGTGNKTLLQGQDQVDSAYAIEIGDAGATTLTNATLTAGSLASGVTGGSGLTALGTVTAGNISHADIVYPAGHVLKITNVPLTSNIDDTGTGQTVIFDTADHVCHGGASNNTTIYPFFDAHIACINSTYRDARKNMRTTYSGATHSPSVSAHTVTLGAYTSFTDAVEREYFFHVTIPLVPVTISAAGTLSIYLTIENVHSSGRFICYGHATHESRIRFVEVQ